MEPQLKAGIINTEHRNNSMLIIFNCFSHIFGNSLIILYYSVSTREISKDMAQNFNKKSSIFSFKRNTTFKYKDHENIVLALINGEKIRIN